MTKTTKIRIASLLAAVLFGVCAAQAEADMLSDIQAKGEIVIAMEGT